MQTQDVEEKEQCERMHEIIKEHKLEGQFRWLVALKDRVFNGELYRYIAGAGAAFRTAWSLKFAWHDAGARPLDPNS